tara:strand:+ start:304 stop:1149 length:846 start_codon:yes stop_codon:yes gene_type:complete
MASTYTNIGIEKPGTGEQAGTWGTTTNTNFDIIDRIGAVGDISLSGTTHTLTASDGSASEAQFTLLNLGGSPSGTNTITISPNDLRKFYIVRNASGQTATFTQGSGANVSVANGASKIIFCDGAGAGAAVTDVTLSLAVPTDLVNDTTPQLGGNLDVNSNEITSASSGNVVVNPNGTGTIELEAATNVTGAFGVTGVTTFTGNAVPEADGTRDLGTTSTRFANVFADNFTSGDMILDNTDRPFVNSVDGTQGRWRIQEGSDSLFIINEVSGDKYKFVLEKV